MTNDAIFIVASAVLIVFSFRGVRTTHRIWRRYRADTRIPRSIILRMIRNVVTYIVGCALWLMFLTLRGLAGFETLEWSRIVNVVLLIGILGGIPEYVERTLDRIERTPIIGSGSGESTETGPPMP